MDIVSDAAARVIPRQRPDTRRGDLSELYWNDFPVRKALGAGA